MLHVVRLKKLYCGGCIYIASVSTDSSNLYLVCLNSSKFPKKMYGYLKRLNSWYFDSTKETVNCSEICAPIHLEYGKTANNSVLLLAKVLRRSLVFFAFQ